MTVGPTLRVFAVLLLVTPDGAQRRRSSRRPLPKIVSPDVAAELCDALAPPCIIFEISLPMVPVAFVVTPFIGAARLAACGLRAADQAGERTARRRRLKVWRVNQARPRYDGWPITERRWRSGLLTGWVSAWLVAGCFLEK